MKKILSLLVLIVVLGCYKDPIDDFTFVEIPSSLIILEPIGIKLESAIVYDKVGINAKFNEEGSYKIKIINFAGKTVSQEIISAKKGDNLLNVYTSALESDSYQVQISDMEDRVLGVEVFTMKN